MRPQSFKSYPDIDHGSLGQHEHDTPLDLKALKSLAVTKVTGPVHLGTALYPLAPVFLRLSFGECCIPAQAQTSQIR